MSVSLTCPRGHPISISEVATLASADELACPVCGAAVSLNSPANNDSEGATQPPASVETPTLTGRPLGAASALPASERVAVPGYEILSELGRGGMGVVYKARQAKLGRVVALKMILTGAHAGEAELVRFRTEAEAIARVQHPNIVQIHEVGEHQGLPYFSLEFCGGGSLQQKLNGTPLPPEEAAALAEALAEAMQAAHDKGIIHRDLKPANVLLAEDGTPKITDFGLAKKLDEAGQTASGAVMGTPSYMAPEQADGQSREIGPACDVYALGAILYECLTGRPPFKGPTAMDTILQVVADEPVPPSRLQTKTPRDLETICLKCLQKEPERRYPSAGALAEDLRRFRAGEPIAARPAGSGERLVKWVRRKPATAALLAVSGLAALALVALGVGLVYNTRLAVAYQSEEEQRKQAEQARGLAEAAQQGEAEQRKKAEDALRLAKQLGYVHSIFLAQGALRDGNVLRARQRLAECKEGLRGWEWRYLNGQSYPELFSFPGAQAVFSPDGTHVAVVPNHFIGDGVVRLFDVRSGQETQTLRARSGRGSPVRLDLPVFYPDGMRLASRGSDGLVRVFDARTGQEAFTLGVAAQFFSEATAPAVSPDGTHLALRVAEHVVRLYDAATGREVLVLDKSAGVDRPVFSPDGTRVATESGDVVRVYDTATGREVFVFKASSKSGLPVFSPDGARIAFRDSSDVRVYDARTGQESFVLKGLAAVGSPVFSPDGSRVAVRGVNGELRLFDARTGQESLALRASAKLGSPVFSPDGTFIAAESGGAVRLYDARTGREAFALKAPVLLDAPVFSPDGSLVAVTPAGMTPGEVVRLYDAREGQEALALASPARMGVPVFSPDGVHLAVTSDPFGGDGVLRVYDARTGLESLALRAPVRIGIPVFNPDGSLIATNGDDGAVRVYDARTGKEGPILKGPAKLGLPAFSSDGGHMAAADQEGVVRVYDTATGQEAFALNAPSRLGLPVFSPDGTCIAAGSPVAILGPRTNRSDGAVRLFDARTGQVTHTLPGELSPLIPLVFSPDGARVAFGSVDGAVRVYDAQTGGASYILKAPQHLVAPVFSPDGSRIAASSVDGVVRVYDAATGQKALAPIPGPAGLAVSTFSPDGTRMAAEGGDGALRLYDVRTGQETLTLQAPAKLSHVVFSPDGARMAAVGADGVVRVWAAPSGAAAWQAERRQAVAADTPAWHRAQAAECQKDAHYFAAAFHLGRLIAAEPRNGSLRYLRGVALAHQRQDAEAKRDFEAALALKDSLSASERGEVDGWLGRREDAARAFADALKGPEPEPRAWKQSALLCVALANREGYGRTCAGAIQRFGKTRDSAVAGVVAWSCCLAPDALPDLTPALQLAQRGARANARSAAHPGVLGAVLYRAGRYEEAAKELLKAAEKEGPDEPAILFFTAMALHRSGKPDEARTFFTRAVRMLEMDPPIDWADRLELDVFRHESEALLKMPAPAR